MMDEVARNPDGTVKDGAVLNPGGNNGHNAGWQRYGERIQKLAEKYSQAEILIYAMDDVKRVTELSYWDGLCVVHMARAVDRKLTKTDSGADHVNKEREAMIDRIEGKTIQRTELTGKDGGPLDIKSDREFIRSKLLSPDPAGGTPAEDQQPN